MNARNNNEVMASNAYKLKDRCGDSANEMRMEQEIK